ncbi:complex I subunit 4 family protein [Fibrobacter succinogenes]|uniref:NADH dehydrogenase subunit M n=1 Tax=Fibrobacter succinogenes TaxID=833 RepID=A0A380RWZ2_FIBSU|nr:NADH-quinone oxidoreductase subunit M [Fibrobacter succinogenes]PWJ37833.1 proton-translocating NADH-quinone oxidoreductase chain M [Fibrobacter succinogenes subsp. elongatus]SUQ20080.1 NADH dehydrogenase subunit M [Fibrobacter succinogenes]
MLLHLLVLAPFVAAILMVMTSKEDSKSSSRLAILMGIGFTAMSVALIAGGSVSTEAIEWFQIPGCKGPVYYYLTSHGLASWMVFLSSGLSLVALISARGITCRSYRNFAIGIFSLMGAMNGTFLAADAVLFFFFFEAMVIPAAVLIAGFGGKDRMKAAMTFAIYTLVGSAPMMVALWYILTIADNSTLISLAVAVQGLPEGTQNVLLVCFLLAFLVKTPIFPFHGWQAITYAEAPAPLSAILTGAMSKAGVFGFIVWILPIFPLSMNAVSCMMWLGLFTAVYGALMALRATDGKKLLAFSSMGHLGLAVAGVFSLSEAMLPAVLVLLVAHGISAGAQFYLMGIAERMAGTRELDKLGGLSSKNPVFSTLFGFAGVMALAVPGTAGFVGEFSVLLALWDMGPLPALVAGFTLILSAAYMLRFIQKVIFGKQAREYEEGRRTMPLEGVSIAVMLLLLLVFGFHPAYVTDTLNEVETTEDPAAVQVLNSAALNNGEAPMTAEEIHQLDSTLAAAGFKDDERASIIAQMKGDASADAKSEKSVKEASDAK